MGRHKGKKKRAQIVRSRTATVQKTTGKRKGLRKVKIQTSTRQKPRAEDGRKREEVSRQKARGERRKQQINHQRGRRTLTASCHQSGPSVLPKRKKQRHQRRDLQETRRQNASMLVQVSSAVQRKRRLPAEQLKLVSQRLS